MFMFLQLTWNEAKEECQDLLLGNGSLLSILSEKEWKDHRTIFERQGEGNLFKSLTSNTSAFCLYKIYTGKLYYASG